MGAIAVLLPILINAIPAGVSLGQFIANLIRQRNQLQQENRPDVTDERIAMLDALIDGLQAHINKGAES